MSKIQQGGGLHDRLIRRRVKVLSVCGNLFDGRKENKMGEGGGGRDSECVCGGGGGRGFFCQVSSIELKMLSIELSSCVSDQHVTTPATVSYGTPEGTFLFQYLPEKKLKQKELENKSKQ